MPVYHALIRTHHIISQRKLAILRAKAKELDCAVVLRVGGVPGLMYVTGRSERPVSEWVDKARRLRYKDFKLLRAETPTLTTKDNSKGLLDATVADGEVSAAIEGKWHEVFEVKDFGRIMAEKRLWGWWREAMGYARS